MKKVKTGAVTENRKYSDRKINTFAGGKRTSNVQIVKLIPLLDDDENPKKRCEEIAGFVSIIESAWEAALKFPTFL